MNLESIGLGYHSRTVFRIYGLLIGVTGIGLIGIGLSVDPATRGLPDWRILTVPGAGILLIGLGTLLLSRICVYITALLGALLFAFLTVGSILSVPFPWMLVNFAFGVIGLIPAITFYRAKGSHASGIEAAVDQK